MASNFSSWRWYLKLASLLAAIGGASASLGNCALAQITSDDTLGAESSVVTPNADINGLPGEQIDGGAVRGTNLFHSFEQFSIPTGSAAYFNNAPEIQNIISRVTGGSVSSIDGLIQTNSTADLFLLNPNGIVFGPNATLNIGGSIVASTASSLNFVDGTQFSATAPQATPLLTLSVPLGLQFSGTGGSILVQGPGAVRDPDIGVLLNREVGLSVQPKETLALVGSNVAIEGGILTTYGGRIELGSVTGSGLVSLTPIDKGWALGYEGISAYGDIHLSGAAAVDASGAGAGDIQVWGRRVTLTNGSQIEASTLGAESGGTLRVSALESVEAIGTTADGLFASTISIQVYEEATGAGGNLSIETGRLIILDGAQIGTGTYGTGAAGNLTVSATESVELSSSSANGEIFIPSRLATDVGLGATGAGGNLNLATKQLIVRDGAQISAFTFGTGSGGTLTVRASESVELSGTSPITSRIPSGLLTSVEVGASGNAGNLNLETQRLIIRDGAGLSTATYGEGSGGDLTVKAYESVELIGKSLDGQRPSTLTAQAFKESASNAGDLRLETGELIVRDGAEIAVSSLNPTSTKGAGSLQVQAQTISLDNQGKLTAETESGQGGDITLQVQDFLLLRRNSAISSTAGNAQTGGDGGNIIINSPFVVAVPSQNSDITANAFSGSGGRVNITAQGIFGIEPSSRQELQTLLETDSANELDPSRLLSNDITAISQTDPSLSGQVALNTPDVDPSQGLVTLPEEIVDVSGLIASGCAAGEGPTVSQFVVTGRGGLPPNPAEVLSSNDVWKDWRSPNVRTADSSRAAIAPIPKPQSPAPTPIVEATGWVTNDKGEVILVATAPTPTAHSPTLTPTDCYAR